MRSVDEHQRVVAALITRAPPAAVPLGDALGLVLADDVVAPLSLPGFDNSAMDGYAVVAEDIAGATNEQPVMLPVAEDIPAGRTDPLTLEARHGTPDHDRRAPARRAPPPWCPSRPPTARPTPWRSARARTPGQHIRRAGEDVTAGTTVLRAGQVLTPAALGLAAALGLGELKVVPRQRVLVMSTGSELVAPGTPLQPGQIYESNAVMLAAAVRDAGARGDDGADDRRRRRRVPRRRCSRHAGDADLIITTGGVSAGAYEVVKDALSADEVEFVKVAMQPGMPQGAGTVGGTPIITLPGNPVSALVSFEVFIRAPLRAAMGLPHPDRPRLTAALLRGSDVAARQAAVPPRRARPPTRARVTSYGPPASHHLRWLASANCLLEIDEDVAELAAGSHGAGMGPVERVATRRIATPWPDAPTSDQAPRDSWRWCAPPFPPMHPAGLPFVGASLAVAAVGPQQPLAARRRAGRRRAPTRAFFRHPPRVPPTRPGLVVAPADGLDLPDRGRGARPPNSTCPTAPLTRISIFLSIFDAHVQRVPIGGEVVAGRAPARAVPVRRLGRRQRRTTNATAC